MCLVAGPPKEADEGKAKATTKSSADKANAGLSDRTKRVAARKQSQRALDITAVAIEGRHRVSHGETLFFHVASPGGGNIVVSGRVKVVGTPLPHLTAATLEAAWCVLQRRHTRLRAWIAETTPGKWSLPFGAAPAADATACDVPPQSVEAIAVATAEQADEAMREAEHRLLHTTFERNVEKVPVSLCIIHHSGTGSYRLVLGVTHVLADLQAAHHAFRELVQSLGPVAFGRPPPQPPASPTHPDPLPAGVEELSMPDHVPPSERGMWNFLMHGGVGAARQMLGMGKYNKALAWAIGPTEQPETCRVVNVDLTESETRGVAAAAKLNGTTVHGLLSAVALHAVRSAVNGHPDKLAAAQSVARRGEITMPLTTTVDLRRRIRDPATPLPPDLQGNLSAALATCMAVPLAVPDSGLDELALWEHARTSRDLQLASLAKRGYVKMLTVVEKMSHSSMRNMAQDVGKKPMLAPVTLGNAGVLPELPADGCEIETLTIAFNNFARVVYVCVATYRGVMRLTMSSSAVGLVDLEFVAGYFARTLRQVAGTSAGGEGD